MPREYETIFRLGAELDSKFGSVLGLANTKITDLDRKLKNVDGQGKNGGFGKGIADGFLKISRAASLAAAGLAAGGIVAAGVVLKNSLSKAMDFESELFTIQALTGATSKEMSQMSALALKMGADTKYNAMEAAQGIEELLKAGLTPAAVQAGGLESALNLATAGGLDLASAAEIMSTALNAYKDDGMSAAHAADVLAGTANASATSVEELRLSLAAVSAVASGVGMNFDDTNVALGLFANNGLKSSDAGTSLKTMLMRLQPTTDAAYNAFDDLGLMTTDVQKSMAFLSKKGVKPASDSIVDVTKALKGYAAQEAKVKPGTARAEKAFKNLASANNLVQSAFYDSKGNLKDLGKIADLLKTKMAKLTNAQRAQYMQTMFGTDAIRASNILFKEGGEGVKEFYKEMSKVTALDVARKKMDNAAGAMEQLSGAFETIQISALLPTMPLIKRAANALADYVTKYTPQITGAMESMVNSAERYLNDHFLANDKFKKLDLNGKISWVIEDFGKVAQAWLNSEQASKIGQVGASIGTTIITSAAKAATNAIMSSPTLSLLLGAAIGMMAPTPIGVSVALSVVVAPWVLKLVDWLQEHSSSSIAIEKVGERNEFRRSVEEHGKSNPDTPYYSNKSEIKAAPKKVPTTGAALADLFSSAWKGLKNWAYADGGFASQASIFGEAGLEAAIPINNKPRSHALLERTNRLMGHSSGNTTFVYSPTINVPPGADEAAVKRVVKAGNDDFRVQAEAFVAQRRRVSMI
ncbi:phage tail tape measure protein [Paenibacillus sp. P22]|uniref:phage tail tape measure protein n=1 Tax=Paenibacillus sp. P22 TaxID=483908 RepID=UPI000431C1C7|nr:phage tail tape measure protein [Paenibacillus sp. P22]CDN41461.1 hypothetical protein BN871_AH_00350 [Paenibacillus sp. P22]